MRHIIIYLFCLTSVFCVNAQDTIATGKYRNYVPAKLKILEGFEKECIRKAQLNALESVFGSSLSDTTSYSLTESQENESHFFSKSLNSEIQSVVSGRWLKNAEPEVIKYEDTKDGKIINVFVKGYVREIKPKSFNEDREAMAEYVKKLYFDFPFNDVSVLENYSTRILISVVELEKAKYKRMSDMNRVANIKAKSQINRYINGSNTEEIFIIRTTELKLGENDIIGSDSNTYNALKETSSGWVSNISLLTSFPSEEGEYVIYVYSKPLPSNEDE